MLPNLRPLHINPHVFIVRLITLQLSAISHLCLHLCLPPSKRSRRFGAVAPGRAARPVVALRKARAHAPEDQILPLPVGDRVGPVPMLASMQDRLAWGVFDLDLLVGQRRGLLA